MLQIASIERERVRLSLPPRNCEFGRRDTRSPYVFVFFRICFKIGLNNLFFFQSQSRIFENVTTSYQHCRIGC